MSKYFLIAWVALVGSVAQAQDGPSYEETVGFLKKKIDVTTNIHYQTLDFPENCVAQIQLRKRKYGESGAFTSTQTAQLDTLDPSRIYSDDGIEVGAREREKVVQYRGEWKFRSLSDIREWFQIIESQKGCSEGNLMCHDTYLIDHFAISNVLPPEEDNKPRVVRALKHLIRLCGGEEELF